MYMLWCNFILGSIFIFLCFILIIIHVHYHTRKQRKIKIEPRIKQNHNIYNNLCFYFLCLIVRKCKWWLFAVPFVIILMKNVNKRFPIMEKSSSELIYHFSLIWNIKVWNKHVPKASQS